MLKRADVHGQPGPLRHVLDARPRLFDAVAGAAGRRGAGAGVPCLCARGVDATSEPRHHDDQLRRSPGRRLRVQHWSLPLLLAALRAAGAEDLVERHRGWLAAEVAWFAQRVVDPRTGLVRADRTYSAHRDTVVNRSTAYGNTMVALLAKTLAETQWVPSPFERYLEGDYGGCCANSSGTAIGSATRWATTPCRAKPTCGRSMRAWLKMTACSRRRSDTWRADKGFCEPYPLPLRDEPAAWP